MGSYLPAPFSHQQGCTTRQCSEATKAHPAMLWNLGFHLGHVCHLLRAPVSSGGMRGGTGGNLGVWGQRGRVKGTCAEGALGGWAGVNSGFLNILGGRTRHREKTRLEVVLGRQDRVQREVELKGVGELDSMQGGNLG